MKVNTTQAKFLIFQPAPLSLASSYSIPYVRNLRINCSFLSTRSWNLICHPGGDSTTKPQLPSPASHLHRHPGPSPPPLISLSLRPWQLPPNWSPCFCSWLPMPAHSPHHSLSFQLELKIKSCHSTAYKYMDVFQPAWSLPTSPHASWSQASHPSSEPGLLAGPRTSRKLSPQGLCTCSCRELDQEKPYLMPSHPSGLNLRIISFKTSSWAKSFVVVKYIQHKIYHFSHL